jgi:hypothetical protein
LFSAAAKYFFGVAVRAIGGRNYVM